MLTEKVPFDHPWNEILIGDIADVIVGGTPSTSVPRFWGGTIPWMASGDIHLRRITDVPGRITELGLQSSSAKLVEPPTVAIALAGQGKTRGTVALTLSSLATNQSVALMKPRSSNLNVSYLFYNLAFRYDELRSRSSGEGRAGLSKGLIEQIPLPLPVVAEQTAIAEILATVDQAIAQTEALIAKQRRIKAGLLHDLLTRGIDAQGNLRDPATHRFKASQVGLVPEEWEVEPLHSYLSFISYGFTNPMPEAPTGPYLVTAANIVNGHIDYESCRHTSKDAFNHLLTPKSRPVENDILLTKDGTLGRLALAGSAEICVNQSVAVLRTNGQIEPQFLKMLLEASIYQAKLIADSGGSTIKHLYVSQVGRLHVAVPQSTQEREKIQELVDVQTTIIDSAVKQLLKLHRLKTGLMQDLLTGRVSVAELATNIEIENPA